MIEVKNLYKSFEGKEVLKNINAVFENGKTNLIIGQSGSGKTVLVKNLVGLLEPTQGEVLYDGRNFVKMTKKEKVLMRREMGMIFQSAALFDSLSVLENVMFPLDMFSDMNLRDRTKRAMECLERVNLLGAENKFPAEISGGMQKRVARNNDHHQYTRHEFCDGYWRKHHLYLQWDKGVARYFCRCDVIHQQKAERTCLRQRSLQESERGGRAH